jgi:hypothetical protein
MHDPQYLLLLDGAVAALVGVDLFRTLGTGPRAWQVWNDYAQETARPILAICLFELRVSRCLHRAVDLDYRAADHVSVGAPRAIWEKGESPVHKNSLAQKLAERTGFSKMDAKRASTACSM